MKVLSLFDGMSCGQLALKKLGIKVDKYYASEIDKYAIQITQKNFPETIQLGDVCNLNPDDFMDVDLILCGSPCQGFSFAGKQLAFDDPRSALFFEFIRLLQAIKPKYFLLENVPMKLEFLQIITEQVSSCYPDFQGDDLFSGVIKPILINSALLSAQSRQRYYWTNIPGVEQPEDKGIVLRDILEDDFDSEKEKSYCLDANYYKGASVEQYQKKSRRQLVNKPDKFPSPQRVGTATDVKGIDMMKRVYGQRGKSPTLLTTNSSVPKIEKELDDTLFTGNEKVNIYSEDGKSPVAGRLVGRAYDEEGKRLDRFGDSVSGKTNQMLELRQDEKSNALTTVTKDNILIKELLEDERMLVDVENKKLLIAEATKKGYTVIEDGDCFDINYPESKTRRGRNMKYKCNALTPTAQDLMRFENLTWRKLLPIECERLQTVPDNYTEGVSNTRRYHMLGNGWTVDVIAHILKNMDERQKPKQS